MKHNLMIGLAIAAIGAGGLVFIMSNCADQAKNATHQTAAQQQTATFAIENMTCAMCPITVKKAMQGVEGVKSVSIDVDARTAAVMFDPTVTTAEEIGEASTNAGFPASPGS